MANTTTRKLIKFSNYSFCVTLPKEAVSSMGWGKGDEVAVTFNDQTQVITISKQTRSKSKESINTNSNYSPETKTSATAINDQSGPNSQQDTQIKPIPRLRW